MDMPVLVQSITEVKHLALNQFPVSCGPVSASVEQIRWKGNMVAQGHGIFGPGVDSNTPSLHTFSFFMYEHSSKQNSRPKAIRSIKK